MNKRTTSLFLKGVSIFLILLITYALISSRPPHYSIDRDYVPEDCSKLKSDVLMSQTERDDIIFACELKNPCPYNPSCVPYYCREEVQYWSTHQRLFSTQYARFRGKEDTIQFLPSCFPVKEGQYWNHYIDKIK